MVYLLIIFRQKTEGAMRVSLAVVKPLINVLGVFLIFHDRSFSTNPSSRIHGYISRYDSTNTGLVNV